MAKDRLKAPREKRKYTFGTFVMQVIVFISSLFFITPLFIIFNYSFKSRRELFLSNPLALPESPNWDNYEYASERLDLSTTLTNTFIYTAVSVLILALVCGAAAWAIVRSKGKFYKIAYYYFIVGILIPAQALFLPIFIIGFRFGLVNTRFGVIFMYVATNISFGIFLMTSFMSTVPIEIEEAARIDGCSVYRTYFSIVLPLLKPAIAALVIMQSFQIWNDFLMASLFASNYRLRNMMLALQGLFSQQTTDYTTAFAAIVMSVLPVIVLFVALQKYFVKGMAVGAVKG